MDYEENMAAPEATEAATADDMLSDEIVEEVEEPAETLDSLMGEEKDDQPTEEPQPEQKGTTEPGYVQKRIDKALARQRESMKAEIMAEMEAQYAPIRDRLLEMDAKELVRQGEFKSVERAKEYLRLKQGMPTEPAAEQPRNEKGQYESRENLIASAKTEARIDELRKQATKIKANGGPDVIAEFSSNEEIKNRVISGELDFYDVAEIMKSSKKRAPAPTRSSNGASGQTPNAIENMTDEQFARMEKKIAEGARYTLR